MDLLTTYGPGLGLLIGTGLAIGWTLTVCIFVFSLVAVHALTGRLIAAVSTR